MIEIINKMRVDKQFSIAIAGAGGKTSLMEFLESSLPGKLVCTTSTKLGLDQSKVYDKHIQLHSRIPDSEDLIGNWQSLLVTDHPDYEQDRFIGLNPDQLLSLKKLCEPEKISLVFEADGARKKLLKAPADWEPVIPAFSDSVIYICALTALDQNLDENVVFRSEIFAELTGSKIGDRITIDVLADYLKHPQGGLKNIPGKAVKILLLSQSDLVEGNLFKCQKIAEKLFGIFDHCFYGNVSAEPGHIEKLF